LDEAKGFIDGQSRGADQFVSARAHSEVVAQAKRRKMRDLHE
jgi:hypothetical protein